jgi:serine/threonine-protein phosphatase 4 regulatory subunit 2
MENFPAFTHAEKFSAGRSAITLGSTLQSAPSTPLFSPIPFLHDDARRSKSRSPPPTPLALDAGAPDEFRALGLVDELDDPRPGHMSDHPTALTAVTTLPAHEPKPFLGSLEQRFVKASDVGASLPTVDSGVQGDGDAMELDDDKENAQS